MGKMIEHVSRKKLKEILVFCQEFLKPFYVTDGKGFSLKNHDCASIGHLQKDSKDAVSVKLERGIALLELLQDKLYAQGQHGILVVLQAMDAAGKDGMIKHVFGGVNPQGCSVTSFKTPSSTENKHDFLWRCACALPERGIIGIFNRSYYEDVLSVRVHPEWLDACHLSVVKRGKDFWQNRMESICDFEKHLIRNGIEPVKVFLHLSQEEQLKRLLFRIDCEEKNWKFSAADMKERVYWDDYQRAFEEMIRQTATKEAPWLVVPADHKWFARVVVLSAVLEKLLSLNLEYPEMSEEKKRELKDIRVQLLQKAEEKKSSVKKKKKK